MKFSILVSVAGALSRANGDLFETAYNDPMMKVNDDLKKEFKITPIYTIGEALPSSTEGTYVPPGILDGQGSWRVNVDTVRLYTNHELRAQRGYEYELCANEECSETWSLTGARISFYDFDIETLKIKDSGVAFKYLYESNGELLTNTSTLNGPGLTRFCSAKFVDAMEYGFQRGIEDKIFFGPEETGLGGDKVGGSYWALDVFTQNFWRVSALGRGAWESITQIDTGSTEFVAFVLPDDTSPKQIDDDDDEEAAPLYLYVGRKDRESNDFLARNGLKGGKLYVFVPTDRTIDSPLTFTGTGNTLGGSFVEIDNSRNPDQAAQDGANGFDVHGYPTQTTLWLRAKAAGAFRLSRPEDISTFSRGPNEFAIVSTGVGNFNDKDRFGTIYTMKVNFDEEGVPRPAVLKILRDGDEDPTRSLRSPDNLEIDDSLAQFVYVNEDKAISTRLDDGKEDLFGGEAVNQNEAQIVRLDPNGEKNNALIIAQIDRSIVLDPTSSEPAVDLGAGEVGDWESSGIEDVSINFGREPGTLFTFSVQAHGIEEQAEPSRINDLDLVEGGQLLFLEVLSQDAGDDNDGPGGDADDDNDDDDDSGSDDDDSSSDDDDETFEATLGLILIGSGVLLLLVAIVLLIARNGNKSSGTKSSNEEKGLPEYNRN